MILRERFNVISAIEFSVIQRFNLASVSRFNSESVLRLLWITFLDIKIVCGIIMIRKIYGGF